LSAAKTNPLFPCSLAPPLPPRATLATASAVVKMSTPKQPADLLEAPDLVLDRHLAQAVQEVAQRVDRRLAFVEEQARGRGALAQQLLPAAEPAGDTGTNEGSYCFPESKTGGAYGHAAGAKDFLVEVPSREEGLRILKEDPGQWAGVWGSDNSGFVPMWKLVKRGSGFAPESGSDFSWVQAKYSGIGPASFKDEIFDAILREHGHADTVQLPSGWQAKFDKKTSKYFYLNHELKLMSWVAPVVPPDSRMNLQELSPRGGMSPQFSSMLQSAKRNGDDGKVMPHKQWEARRTDWTKVNESGTSGMAGGANSEPIFSLSSRPQTQRAAPGKQVDAFPMVSGDDKAVFVAGEVVKTGALRTAEADAHKQAEEEERKRKAKEEEMKRKAEEEERERKAEEDRQSAEAACKKSDEEAQREEERKRMTAEAEARKKAEEERQRKTEDEERKRKAGKEERERKAEEDRRAAESARKKAAEEAQREEERKRLAAEADARKKLEEERKRKTEEERQAAEAARMKVEEEAEREDERKREVAKNADDSAAREREEKKRREEKSREAERMAVHKAPAGAGATTASADPAVQERKQSNLDIYRQARQHQEKLAQKKSNKEEDTGVLFMRYYIGVGWISALHTCFNLSHIKVGVPTFCMLHLQNVRFT
jgi:DNA segregation ATPase FtsK/SpoIIIE-like protein